MTSTDIVKRRKTNDYENLEKGMIYMKILKKEGVVEKRGEEETKSMPHAPVISTISNITADTVVIFFTLTLVERRNPNNSNNIRDVINYLKKGFRLERDIFL